MTLSSYPQFHCILFAGFDVLSQISSPYFPIGPFQPGLRAWRFSHVVAPSRVLGPGGGSGRSLAPMSTNSSGGKGGSRRFSQITRDVNRKCAVPSRYSTTTRSQEPMPESKSLWDMMLELGLNTLAPKLAEGADIMTDHQNATSLDGALGDLDRA
jgi:hypothetical protein